MSSNNRYILQLIFLFLLLVFGCKKNDQPINLNDQRAVRNVAKDLINADIEFTTTGYFSSELSKSIVAGTETTNRDQSGITFYLIEKVDDEFEIVYKTGVLAGSFDKCLVDKMKLSSGDGEMIYYNSQSYFLGSSGGDVFSYVIDMVKKEVYYAHLIAKNSRASLYLSENIQDPFLRKFFISYFKKDYGTLNMLKSDIL